MSKQDKELDEVEEVLSCHASLPWYSVFEDKVGHSRCQRCSLQVEGVLGDDPQARTVCTREID